MTSASGHHALPQTPSVPDRARFASIGSPYFGIMLAVMAVVLILSNIGASKGVAIGPIITDGGFFLFPLDRSKNDRIFVVNSAIVSIEVT